MSATEEREIEIVAGTIGGITQKKADTWTIQVTPEGSQYAKNLWTKDVELVESLGSKIGQHGTFVGGLGAPYTVNGKEVRSWWIQEAGPEGERVSNVSVESTGSVATPAAAPIAGASKDRLIVRQTCIKAAAELTAAALRRSDTAEEDYVEVTMKAAARFERWVTLGILEPIPFD